MNVRFAVATLACLAGSLVLHAGQAPSTSQLPTFRVEARFVEVDTVVLDEDGHFVTNLTKDDFEILEDGQPQAITNLTMVNLPIDPSGRPGGAAPGGLDVPAPITSPGETGRVYVLILDSGAIQRVKEIARQFIVEYLGPTDLMAIVHTMDREATQGLTNDRTRLLESVNRYREGLNGGLVSFRAIKEVAVNLNSVSGRRKAILFVGRGVDLWQTSSDQTAIDLQRQLWREYDDAAKASARNNVRIYPIDPSGMRSAMAGIGAFGVPHFADIAGSSNPFVPLSSLASAPMTIGGRTRGVDFRHTLLPPRPDEPNPEAQSSLRLMAEDTGGIAIVNTNNFGGNFTRVVRDNSAYYVLGYYSPAPRDGRFHRITVGVKNRPDLTVRGSRAGFNATTPDVKGPSVKLPKGLSAASRDALRSSQPVVTLPVEIFTAVYQADAASGSILVGTHIPGSMLKLAPKEQLELSYVAVDRSNRVRAAQRRAYTLTLDSAMRARVEQTGLRLFGRLQVPRGRYEIRVVAHQPGGLTGSAVADVEIPDYADLPLSVSDLVVASSGGRPQTTLEEDAVLRKALPSQPTTSRRFARGETLTFFGEVYDSHWMLSQEIGVTATVTAQDGRVVSREEQTLKSANHGRFSYTGRVGLGSAPTGTFTLTMEAHTRTGVPASASQQLRFEVAEP